MARSYTHQTIKLLFARARYCAYPGCKEQLVLEHRARLTVVAEIAHIRSEKPDGPRYDPAYPALLINEEENLLLLCGKHHKPVDDHESVYPTDELLDWKRSQVAATSERQLSDGQVERIFLHYDLSRLGHESFEKVCQALTVQVLGPGTEFGPGPDGRWDASFDGRATGFPNPDTPWDGFILMEAIYSSAEGSTRRATQMLEFRIKNRFKAWSARVAQGGRRPDYVIFATNLALDGEDRVTQHLTSLIDFNAAELGVREWRIWDETQIADLLAIYPDVRHAVSSLSTSNEIVEGVLDALSAGLPVDARFHPGQPGLEASFQLAYDAAGGVLTLGHALGPVQEHRLGWLQHFSGGTRGEPAVLCALYGKKVIAVAATVWNDIEAIGNGVVHGGSVGAGFPVSGEPARNGYLGSDAEKIDLMGGQWGPAHRGRLLRLPSSPAVWQPATAFDSNASRDRDAWSSLTDQRDLRIRVAARIPFAVTEWRISSVGRALLLDAVETAGITTAFHALADRYSLEVPPGSWQEIGEPDGVNNSRFAAYQITARDAETRDALALCFRVAVPDRLGVDLHTTVDLRADFTTLSGSVERSRPIPAALRVTHTELKDFYTNAWSAATNTLLLAAVEDPLTAPPAGAPRLELHIQNEQSGNSDRRATIPILDMIDLSPIGSPRGTGPASLSVGVTTALGLPASEIAEYVDRALIWMIEDAGFVTPPKPM
ncbi:HNH endonuclease signature motif containing protein [Amycolatopsis thailandensis]|uniref:HNH endonuclease signature motif containing protein n=1 Tax=Amycolatopsis thailandensis TaxID=589330 RepID=UPI00362A067F